MALLLKKKSFLNFILLTVPHHVGEVQFQTRDRTHTPSGVLTTGHPGKPLNFNSLKFFLICCYSPPSVLLLLRCYKKGVNWDLPGGLVVKTVLPVQAAWV